MKKLLSLFILIILFLLQSCLTYRSIEFRITFNDNFDRGIISMNYNDLQSTDEDLTKQEDDFNGLIELIFDDAFLLDNVDQGIYVKDRKLWEEDGVLKANFIGIFQKLKLDDDEFKIENEERMLILNNEGDQYECNGKVLQTEKNVILVWPKDQKELYWKQIIAIGEEPTFSLIDFYNKWENKK